MYLMLLSALLRSDPNPPDGLARNLLELRNGRQRFRKAEQMPIRDWKPALNRFAIEFGDRFPS
jgi:transposase-like protein